MLNSTLVREWMTTPVITVAPESPIRAAYNLMKDTGIRHLPVVEQEELVGILSIGDIREASPSDATTLSVWEMNYLWDKLTVDRAMTTKVLTVGPDDLLLDAVRLMLEQKISSLPVVDHNKHLIGILTESDVFRLVIHEAERVKTAL
ncbi:MAG: CBS domain-containing protein [Chloroflexi bacterium]|nr:CBS domain-containing protein [Chloroflexota bacterium]